MLWTLGESVNNFEVVLGPRSSFQFFRELKRCMWEKKSQFLMINFPIKAIVGNEQPTNQLLGHLFYISVPNSL